MEEPVDDFLAHYGVMGMKWGKHSRPDGVSARTNRQARSDAIETARAKMYYGEGAGIRRRLISNSVKSKMKDPSYKKAFDHHLANQDMSKRASEARSKRKRTDTSNGVKKTAKGVGHILRGNNQYANMAAVAVVGTAAYAHKAGIDKMLLKAGKEAVNSAKVRHQVKNIMDQIKNYQG